MLIFIKAFTNLFCNSTVVPPDNDNSDDNAHVYHKFSFLKDNFVKLIKNFAKINYNLRKTRNSATVCIEDEIYLYDLCSRNNPNTKLHENLSTKINFIGFSGFARNELFTEHIYISNESAGKQAITIDFNICIANHSNTMEEKFNALPPNEAYANASTNAVTTLSYDYYQIDFLNALKQNANTTALNNINFMLANSNNSTEEFKMNETLSLRCPDFNDQEFARFEFWICGVILNLVGLLGILGNILSMIILSRPQMRSSINYLLIGLARCDTLLIITSILLFGIPSIYPYTGYLFYYYYYIYPNISPCMFPIAMAAQTSSVYMTFTVTLERYVAVCHPLKARALCTYGRAKIYFLVCILFAFLYNIPRFWEVIVITDTLNYNSNIPVYNNLNTSNNSIGISKSLGNKGARNGGGGVGDNSITVNNKNSSISYGIINSRNNNNIYNNSFSSSSSGSSSSSSSGDSDSIYFNTNNVGELIFNNSYKMENTNDLDYTDNDDNVIYCVIASSLRRNDKYINVYIHWCYLIFIYFIPFFSLALLNCLIYRQVQKANRERQRLSRTERREIGLATMLLCVVVVFFLLNFLALYTNILEAFYDIIDDYLIKISNLLVTINSSANFIIYVIFGEKFKRIFLLLFCKGRMGRDTPDLIHYESSISNGDNNNRSSGRFSRHGTQRSTTAISLNRHNYNVAGSNNNNNNSSNNNNALAGTAPVTAKRIKRNRAPSPGPCVYYPAREVQRQPTSLTSSTSLHFESYNKSGNIMTSGL